MSLIHAIPCPDCGHKRFQKTLSAITLGDSDKPEQLSKSIRPYTLTQDELGLTYEDGELQKVDLIKAQSMFTHSRFIGDVMRRHQEMFLYTQCRVYQFQTILPSGDTFIFGTVITDSSHNLVDFCIDTHLRHKRRGVLMSLIRALCTPASVSHRINH